MTDALPVPAAAADLAAVAEALRPAILKLGRRLRRETQAGGLSAADGHLLATIDKRPGIGVSELAACEQMSSPSMSAHVKRLAAAGWLGRDDSAGGDRRRTRLMLTCEGKRALAALRRSRTDWLVAHLGRLGAEEIATLATAAPVIARLAEIRP